MLRVKEIHRDGNQPFAFRLLIESSADSSGPAVFWVKYDPQRPDHLDLQGIAGVTPSWELEEAVKAAVEKYQLAPGSRVEIAEPPPPGGPRKTIVVTPEPAVAKAKANDPTVVVTAQINTEAVLALEDTVKKLPRWARVAFAARCARRVLSVFDLRASGRPAEVSRAVSLAEEYAAAGGVGIGNPDGAAQVRDAADQVALILPEEGLRMAAGAAAIAADAAYGAAIRDEELSDAIAAADSAIKVDESAKEHISAAQWSDLHSLVNQVATQDGWTDETPVPQNVFGPLWPNGPPPGWPEPLIEVASTPEAGSTSIEALAALPPGITVYLDPGDASQELITEFYLALSDLYRAHGGAGLDIVSDELGTAVTEEVEA